MEQICGCCNENANIFKSVYGYNYYKCNSCGTIFIDNEIISKIDKGESLVKYNEFYWNMELESSKQRSYGTSLARMAEVCYYCRIKINKFLDIGSGAGYVLDAIERYLPSKIDMFYAVEKFPPINNHSKSSNYFIGEIEDFANVKFEAGMCIEVIEHLTPNMLKDLLKQLSKVSRDGAFYIFNTGMPDYVINEDIEYLDPNIRGHIISYSIRGIESIARNYGFTVIPIKGKSWAFGLEYNYKSIFKGDTEDRIWKALSENIDILRDNNMGNVLEILGLETARAYK